MRDRLREQRFNMNTFMSKVNEDSTQVINSGHLLCPMDCFSFYNFAVRATGVSVNRLREAGLCLFTCLNLNPIISGF